MKYIRLLIYAVILAFTAFETSSCSTAPSGRVQTVQTLAAVGLTAKSSINEAAQMLKRGEITVAQWQKVAKVYDTQFQPTYAVAVKAVRSDLSSVASPELVALAAQIAALVAQLTIKPVSP